MLFEKQHSRHIIRAGIIEVFTGHEYDFIFNGSVDRQPVKFKGCTCNVF